METSKEPMRGQVEVPDYIPNRKFSYQDVGRQGSNGRCEQSYWRLDHPTSYTWAAPNDGLGKGYGVMHGEEDRESDIKADISTAEYALIE